MKDLFLSLTLLLGFVFSTHAQSGDLYSGLTRKLGFDRMIAPYGIEVTFDKTTHIIFPAPIRYVDLGSSNLIAGKADGAENVVRIKAAVAEFPEETNFSVICEDGSFFSFNVKYADEPKLLNIEMKDFLRENAACNIPNNFMEVYLKELKNESPMLVKMIMRSIYKADKRDVKHIGSKRFGIQLLMKGIYVHKSLFYLHLSTKNNSNVPFETDFIRFKIVDKKVAKCTAIQETVVLPVRSYNEMIEIAGKITVRTVYVLEKFTIPDDKILVIDLHEKNGGRHQTMKVENSDITAAKEINELSIY